MNNTEHQLNNEKTQERFRQEQESQKNLERIQELEKKIENEKSENESLKNRSNLAFYWWNYCLHSASKIEIIIL